MKTFGVRLSLFCIVIFCTDLPAEQTVGPAAKAAAELSGASKAADTPQKLLAVLKLINAEAYPHRKQGPENGGDGPPPKGIDHPYEWDSKRTSEEMLANGDGGSCGTHALSIAATLRAANVPAADIRVMGGVDVDHYQDICPGKAGEPRAKEWNFDGKKETTHPANGHMFVLVKWGGQWHLVNSTHNPMDPGPPGANLKKAEVRPQDLTLEHFEMTKVPEAFVSGIGKAERPLLIPQTPFPSYFQMKGENGQPFSPLLAFRSWAFEDYPAHTIGGRADLVASGTVGNPTCRWGRNEVAALAPPAPPPAASKGPAQPRH